ncbi:unnamed protein product, partial [Brenthis ino]
MNSVLNPEAPEFYPHLTSVTQGGYTSVHKSIKSSNYLPGGTSYDIFKTFNDFNIVSCQLSKNVILQTSDIVITEIPAVKLKQVDTPSGQHNEGTYPVWTNKPVITKIKVGSTMFIGAKNIPRPQLNFKDPIDNSDNLWVPKISDKPNNIKPLALNILYNEEGEAVGYEHPYKVELDLYQPPAHFIQPDPEPPTFPPPLEDTKLTYIDTEELVDELVNHLDTVEELAVDVEHHSYRTYQGITCLIQISTIEGDFIIDALAVREHIHKLNLSFTDPKKLKVFHGAEMDILWLQRDFGLYVVGMFDTHQAARALNISGLSLKSLLMRYCGVDADKKYQLADWRIRPLPDELVQYARMDTHYLLYIWRRMKGELLDAGEHILLSVFEQSRQICGATYNKQVITETSHMPLYVRSKKSFNSRQMAALRLLYRWRDAQARELDESTTYLLPNHMVLALAETLPREVQGVAACCSPAPPFLRQHLVAVHRMLLSCRELPLEPQLYQMPSSVVTMAPQQRVLTYNVHDLSHFPEYKDDTINLDQTSMFLEQTPTHQPDVVAFRADDDTAIVSDLNVDAKMFIPPYDRYRKYRTLAQVEEIKEYKDKEAKIAAISKGNELIKTEVLLKLQEAKIQKEKEGEIKDKTNTPQKEEKPIEKNPEPEIKQTAQRKRKISNEKCKKGDVASKNKNKVKNKIEQINLKPYNYKNVNYRKFRDDSEKAHKQTKMKFKKHK